MSKIVDNATFRRFVGALRSRCPIDAEIRVSRRKNLHLQNHPMNGCILSENIGGLRFVTILICEESTQEETIDALIHEWAHALSDDMTHSRKWGIAYAKCYRAFHGCA